MLLRIVSICERMSKPPMYADPRVGGRKPGNQGDGNNEQERACAV